MEEGLSLGIEGSEVVGLCPAAGPCEGELISVGGGAAIGGSLMSMYAGGVKGRMRLSIDGTVMEGRLMSVYVHRVKGGSRLWNAKGFEVAGPCISEGGLISMDEATIWGSLMLVYLDGAKRGLRV